MSHLHSRIGHLAMLAVLALGATTAVAAQEADLEGQVADILFDFDELASEQVIYKVREDGLVEITIDDDVPYPLYRAVLDRLRANPQFDNVVDRSADICPKIIR